MLSNLANRHFLGRATIAILPIYSAIAISPIAIAQVTFDGTLGNVAPGAAPNPGGGFTYQVAPDQGLQVGNINLFHSFDQLTLNFGESIRFESPGFSSIITRVTGGSISDIAGTISVAGNSDFYLINPSGIVFNEGATLDVNGAFIASTSPGLFFNNGAIEFRALNPQSSDDVLLSVTEDPGAFNQAGRQGDLFIQDVLLEPNGLDLRFDADDIFVGNSDLSVPNGFLLIEGQNVSIFGNSRLSSATFGNDSAGIIFINAENRVFMDDSVLFANSVTVPEDSAVLPEGNAGLILVQGSELIFDNVSELRAETTGTGQPGIIALRTDRQGSITFRNQSAAFSSVEGNGQSESIGVPPIFESDLGGFFPDGTLLSELTNSFNAFNIVVDTGTLNLDNISSLQTAVRGEAERNGVLFSSGGTAGWIGVFAEAVNITNGNEEFSPGIFSSVGSGTSIPSTAGAIVLEVGDLILDNGGVVSSSIFSDGTSGIVAVFADGTIALRDSDLGSFISEDANTTVDNSAFEGAVFLEATSILLDNSSITVANEGIGNAGNIDVSASLINLVNDSEISAEVNQGEGGDIFIVSNDSLILESSNITVDNEGALGTAGNILTVSDVIILNDNSSIRAETVSASEGGNIALGANFLVLANDSNVTTDSQNIDGRGGNILLEVPGIIYATPSRDSNIRAVGRNGGDGGIITFLSAPLLSNIAERDQDFTDSNDITTFGAVEGEVGFRSGVQDVNPVQEQVTLPTNLVDASSLIAQGCAAGNLTAAEEIGELVVTGRGGLPPAPGDQISDAGGVPSLIELPDSEASESDAAAPIAVAPQDNVVDAASSETLIEAQGWRYGEDGAVVLTASADTATPTGLFWVVPGCDDVF